jgi:hypothetical protein
MEAITVARLLRMVLVVALGCALSASAARADIYTWTDAGGRVNISNLTPPDGVRVTSVLRETPKPPAQRAIDPVPQADVQALAERVRQLEWEADLARRQSPPPTVIYAAAPPQQPIAPYPYAPEPPPPPSYAYDNGYGCDPSWAGCGFLWSPFGYPASVVVLSTPRFHRPGAFHGMHRTAFPQPMRPPRPPPGRSPGGMHRR